MSTTIKSLLIIFAAAFFQVNPLYAQQVYASSSNGNNSVSAAITGSEKNIETTAFNNVAPDGKSIANHRLLKVFSTLFPGADSGKWSETDHIFQVSFLNNGRKSRASFNENGTMNYAITDCSEDQLPGILTKFIKANYDGYTLFNMVKINAYNTTAYQVILENADEYITIKSTNEGVEETGHVRKILKK